MTSEKEIQAPESSGGKGKRHGLVLVVVLLLAGALLWFIPLPNTIYNAPGKAQDAAGLVRVDGHLHQGPGRFLLATVYHRKANPILWLNHLVAPGTQLITPDRKLPSLVEYERLIDRQTEQCHYLAQVAALKENGTPLTIRNLGVKVVKVLPAPELPSGIPRFKHELREGDLILAIAGKTIQNPAFFAAEVQRLGSIHENRTPKNSPLRNVARIPLTVKRNGAKTNLEIMVYKTVMGVPPNLVQRYVAGIYLAPEIAPIELPVKIGFDRPNLRGSSAGLMLALEILGQLQNRDLARGMVVAGTGTIDADGNVGPVQNLELKMISASKAGASVFLYPRANQDDANSFTAALPMVPVSTLAEALEVLSGKRPPASPPPPGSARANSPSPAAPGGGASPPPTGP